MNATGELSSMLGSGLMGLAALCFGWVLLTFARPLAAATPASGAFEQLRRRRLREGSSLYRTCEAVVDYLASRDREKAEIRAARPNALPGRLDQVRQALVTAGEKLPWLPEEYVACRRIEGASAGLVVMLLVWQMFGSFIAGLLVGGFVAFAYPHLAVWSLQGRAVQRRRRLLERLPFALDLMALMMEAGGSFPECLAAAVNEIQNHPLGDELGEVLREIGLGRTRKDALGGLKQRMQDDDVAELVFALVKGDELGTPLAQTLRTQATQMLLKRAQTVEKESAEAQVMIVFPGMVIMVACLLIIIAPFLLQALYTP